MIHYFNWIDEISYHINSTHEILYQSWASTLYNQFVNVFLSDAPAAAANLRLFVKISRKKGDHSIFILDADIETAFKFIESPPLI